MVVKLLHITNYKFRTFCSYYTANNLRVGVLPTPPNYTVVGGELKFAQPAEKISCCKFTTQTYAYFVTAPSISSKELYALRNFTGKFGF